VNTVLSKSEIAVFVAVISDPLCSFHHDDSVFSRLEESGEATFPTVGHVW
jgi:hypothetical protein